MPTAGDAASSTASSASIEASCADLPHVQRTERAAARVRDDAGIRIDLADPGVPQAPEFQQPLLAPENVGAAGRVLRIRCSRKIVTGGRPEILRAMFAVTLARAVPTVDENPIHAVARHEFLFHFGHELEIVRTQPAGDPHLWRRPMTAGFSVRVHGDPIEVRRGRVVVGRVRIGAHDDHESKFAAAGDEFAEHVATTEPAAAMVKGNLGGIIRHAAAAAEADRVRVGALKIIQPERQVELAGIVLNERELCPSHRLVNPGWGRRRRQSFGACPQARRQLRQRDGGAGGLEKLSACERRAFHFYMTATS